MLTPAAVLVLVAGLLVVALIVGAALVLQRRRDRAPAPARDHPTWPPAARPEPALFDDTPPTDPITTRTAQADPPTVRHAFGADPAFGEGQSHPTPPPSTGNGRSRDS